MKLLSCEKCGSTDFIEQDGSRVCCFCRSRYAVKSVGAAQQSSTISLSEDVERLLRKCREEPANAKRYASMILDIDPNNSSAKEFIVQRIQRRKLFGKSKGETI